MLKENFANGRNLQFTENKKEKRNKRRKLAVAERDLQ